MAMTDDQWMMLAGLGGEIGASMGEAYDNPFAVATGNWAARLQKTRAFVQALQEMGTLGEPPKKEEEEEEEQKTSALTTQNPFSLNYGIQETTPSMFGAGQSMEDIRDQIFTPGVTGKVDANNKVVLSREFPAQINAAAGGGAKPAAGGGAPTGVNPFQWPGWTVPV